MNDRQLERAKARELRAASDKFCPGSSRPEAQQPGAARAPQRVTSTLVRSKSRAVASGIAFKYYDNMYEYESPQALLRSVREVAALTQRELAERAGVAQPVVSRLESSPDANPSVRTVAELAAAAGFRLRVVLEPIEAADPVVERYKQDVDRASLRENLRKSIDERVRSLGEWQEDAEKLRAAAVAARAARPKRK